MFIVAFDALFGSAAFGPPSSTSHFGGGPWLDGRVRLAQTVLGYGEKWIDSKTPTYFNTARGTIDAFGALVKNRAKLVFLVEARPAKPADVLRPGLPVEVTLAEMATK